MRVRARRPPKLHAVSPAGAKWLDSKFDAA
jgi:hypothetical protein